MTKQFRNYIKYRFPFLVTLWRKINDLSLMTKSPDQIFTEIYRGNKWGDNDSFSGPGSNLVQTEAVRRALPLIINELNCRSLLDIPCGDFFWMKMVKMDIEYLGGDIVAELIQNNQRLYGAENCRFIHLDLIHDRLPKSDLILCRDCFVHLSFSHIYGALKNIKKSGSTYLLTTTSVEKITNNNVPTGSWRPINLQLPPFNFPAPMKLIDEEYPVGNSRRKYLGLWKIAEIPKFE